MSTLDFIFRARRGTTKLDIMEEAIMPIMPTVVTVVTRDTLRTNI